MHPTSLTEPTCTSCRLVWPSARHGQHAMGNDGLDGKVNGIVESSRRGVESEWVINSKW
jgi:hypothetical protein